MNQHLQSILNFIQQDDSLSAEEKSGIIKSLKDADKELEITAFKLDRTEKVKRTTAILLEEAIEELEQKRKAVEAQNRELEIEASLEHVRTQAMGMGKPNDLLGICEVLFTELQTLGFSELRNAMINIHNDDTGSFLNYDFSGAAGATVTTIFYNSHPATENLVKQIRGTNDAFAEFVIKGDELTEWRAYRKRMGEEDDPKLDHVDALSYYFYSIGIGGIGISTYSPVTEEKRNLLKRFRNVFELAYRRYIDITQAEAQAREAQIELALERVRARTMAMQQSNELAETVSILFKQLLGLGIRSAQMRTCAIVTLKPDEPIGECWITKPNGDIIPESFIVPYNETSAYKTIYEAWKQGEKFLVVNLSGDALLQHLAFLKKYANIPTQQFQALPDQPTETYTHAMFFSQGYLFVITNEPVPEYHAIFKRFGAVFQQTYTRFLDLQKAEAQAREAQIELSLERVRAKTMAMHNSQDVGDTVATMFDELVKLGVETIRCGIGIMDETKEMELWTAKPETGGKVDLIIGRMDMTMHPLLQGAYDGWKKKQEFYTYELMGDDLINYFNAINNHPDYPVKYDIASLPSRIIHSEFHFAEGTLFVFSLERLSAETSKIFKRFAGVFGQTYRRYLDLKKAEAQARHAQIEAAMEKVRARSLAMQKPEELAEVAEVLRKEMGSLGVEELETSSIYIIDETKGTTECWYAIKDIREEDKKLVNDHMTINLPDTWVGRQMLKFYTSNEKQTSILMQGENRKEWINYCAQHSKVLQEGYYGDTIPERTYHLLKFSSGYMGAASPGSISVESWDLLQRATSVFSFAYTRFLDLQKSEANTREAVRRSSLDRVRAETASMRTTGDLEIITPLIWNELTILGIPFIRCGVFIMDEQQQQVHTFLSTPDGKAIAAFHLPYTAAGEIPQVVEHWHRKEMYRQHWDEAAFIEWTKSLVQQGAIETGEKYITENHPTNLDLHFLPFLQGMLYVGNTSPLSNDDIQVVQTLADAFSNAYARYEDFNKLESAKEQIEKTLAHLKQAQAQLVQSEKMASLGELTAGIAHEIQNPLNFVNNFSDVSSELVDEMNAEMERGNLADAKQIAQDLKQNLEKINHHGKRAGDIVKGMLQHSRSSNGVKEPTDINALADEYLRLSYHGLRAKNKSFNAILKTDYDESIDNINIIPQDIGRVLLNLYNNAFYAINEKSQLQAGKYEPLITVSTKKINGKVEIRVRDNGNGIPSKISDKIFQPFFTTKPTGQGTGLGLSLSYDIVKTHGGELRVETTEGEGAEFIIHLPGN